MIREYRYACSFVFAFWGLSWKLQLQLVYSWDLNSESSFSLCYRCQIYLFILSSHVIGVLKLLRLGFRYYFLKGFSFVWLSSLLLLTFTLLFLWLVLWCSTVCLVFLQQFPLIKLLDGPTTASTTPKRSLKENFSFPRNISYGNFFAFCIWLNIADCGQFVSSSLI